MSKPVIGFSLDPADIHRIDAARRRFAPQPVPSRGAFCRAAVLQYLSEREGRGPEPAKSSARCPGCGEHVPIGATRCADCGG